MKKPTRFIAIYLGVLLSTKVLVFFYDIHLAQTFGSEIPLIVRQEASNWYRLVAVLPDLVIGLWLFVAHKASFPSRVIWALFGAVGGFLALLVFYCLRIHEEYKSTEIPGDGED